MDLASAAVEEGFEVRLPDSIAAGRKPNVRDFTCAAFVPERGFRESKIGRPLLAGHQRRCPLFLHGLCVCCCHCELEALSNCGAGLLSLGGRFVVQAIVQFNLLARG